MPKLKAVRCHYCSKPIQRHDTKREKLRIASGSGQGVYRYYHLKCYQVTGH